MDLVYTIGAGSKCDDLELRYSIRSMVKHLQGFDRIVLVGHKPSWIKDVLHIPSDDPHQHNRARNIYDKILKAARHPEVSENFICASDDHFLLADHDAATYPYYQCGSLEQCIARLGKTNYYKSHVESTYNALTERGLPTLNFNIHSPILYNKSQFVEVMESYDWTIRRGYISKSLYCNSLQLNGPLLPDSKLHAPRTKTAIQRFIAGRKMFSTNEHSVNQEMREVLEELYPVASKWE